MKMVVIADDLTGAAEVAGAALRFGLSAEVHVGQIYASHADVIVVDADSRPSSPEVAARKVHALTMQALKFHPDVLFKKVDSLLRGPVAAEISAMQEAGDFERCLLVCGNPRKRRTVVGGKILVDNIPLHETEFANDPEHPRSTNDVAELLAECSTTDIGDVSCAAELHAHALRWHSRRRKTLAAGGAEFFEAVLAVCRAANDPALQYSDFNAAENFELVPNGDVLLVSGSSMTQCDDWPVVPLHRSATASELATEVCRTLSRHGRAAMRAVDFADGQPETRIEKLAEVACRVLGECQPSQVWIEGGRTASTLIRELGYQRLVAVANAGDGIVAIKSIDENSPLYLIKPGSYRWTTQHRPAIDITKDSLNQVDISRLKPASYVLANKLLLLLALLGFAQPVASQPPDFATIADTLVQQCIDCHNADTKEGAVDLAPFQSLDDIDRDRSLWKTLFDVVEAGQMPLPQSGYELDEAQRISLLSFARKALSRPDPTLKAIDPGKPILRRLTRLEYNNTVRDLFELDYDIFVFPERLPVADKSYFNRGGDFQSSKIPSNANVPKATESRRRLRVVQTSMREYGQKYDVLLPQFGLPSDNRAEHGFANRGDALNFSPLLFEKYVQMAAAIASSERLLADSRVLQKLLGIEPPTPASTVNLTESVALRGDYASRDRIGKEAAENDTWHNSFVSELTAAFEHGSGGTFDVPAAMNNQSIAGKGGLLKIRVHQEVLLVNPNIDLWLASFATADETSGDHLLTNRNKGEKVFELTFAGQDSFDPQIQHLGVCVLARRNQSGRVQLTAVLSNGQRLSREAKVDDQSGNVFFSWVAPPGTTIKKLAVDGSAYSGDYFLLDDFGFIFANQPRSTPSVQQEIEISSTTRTVAGDDRAIEERIAEFLSRAYRRDLSEVDLPSALALVRECVASGASETEALQRLVQSVLSSPEFLFLAEPIDDTAATIRLLQPHELASRLSYFLWSSMPDDELLAAAESGTIRDAEILRAQVCRMIAQHARSRELSESFAVQWLRLDQLYSSKPDRKLFEKFYSGPQGKSTLHGPMMTEALLLFETVLAEDLSILELFDPDFTWLNGQLAKLYGLQESFDVARVQAITEGSIPATLSEKSTGNYWLRTQLPDRTRGGVLTMGGPLTLTSLPYRTSPIKRGAWLLETVFNRPPREPKVAFVLEETAQQETDDPQTQTIRQLFEKHRSDPNCFSCHSRIDPPGFSLEVFDAMGALRTHDGEHPVDASGSWNDHQFTNPAEFKDAIRVREQELVRGFVEHLLSYSLGRELEHFDMHTVDQIVSDTADNGYRISAIIEAIVLSYPFQHVRNQR